MPAGRGSDRMHPRAAEFEELAEERYGVDVDVLE
ncbi:prolyl-tRNA editing protein, partial [Halorubrum distributum]